MRLPELASFQKKSLINRLLWPVNIISFVLLVCFCFLMIFKVQSTLKSAMESKIESISTFLQTVGQTYLTNYDIAALESFSNIATRDNDFAFVVYLDEKGKALTESSRTVTAPNIQLVNKVIKDRAGKSIGSVSIGYKTDVFQTVFWQIALLGGIAVFLIQSLSSLSVFFISKNAFEPIRRTLSSLSKTSSVLSKTSNEISKFSQALADGVGDQSGAVQNTTSAMNEMSGMLNQTASHAKQSEEIMLKVTQKANNGMNIMTQMVSSMNSVKQANDHLVQIADIIREISTKTNVINSIVFKTQLLSFNASIEAARAGQHGRGFAVVAEEVGKLANMSGKAAKEIASLIGDSEKQVDDIIRNTQERVVIGRQATEEAFKSFKEIASDIYLVSTQIVNISTATNEQELGIVQTNKAMSDLNRTTDLNHDIAERSKRTSQALEFEVQGLDHIARSIETSIRGTSNRKVKKIKLADQDFENSQDSNIDENKRAS